ncbi:uncharacterized protein JN550_012292 [Neoarthrinium moseri]|uniref:uncharacterized protein n=1 Tax=Neoarthrinium moseri TaxID=1658444 RepID=UPI001FDC2801|nr:uncharacterized protein JN550_012292 [Neoarthrinium moseri]KAI1858934.1 hypothetical protein JN550_012292 [Neoarthrinium moseri]
MASPGDKGDDSRGSPVRTSVDKWATQMDMFGNYVLSGTTRGQSTTETEPDMQRIGESISREEDASDGEESREARQQQHSSLPSSPNIPFASLPSPVPAPSDVPSTTLAPVLPPVSTISALSTDFLVATPSATPSTPSPPSRPVRGPPPPPAARYTSSVPDQAAYQRAVLATVSLNLHNILGAPGYPATSRAQIPAGATPVTSSQTNRGPLMAPLVPSVTERWQYQPQRQRHQPPGSTGAQSRSQQSTERERRYHDAPSRRSTISPYQVPVIGARGPLSTSQATLDFLGPATNHDSHPHYPMPLAPQPRVDQRSGSGQSSDRPLGHQNSQSLQSTHSLTGPQARQQLTDNRGWEGHVGSGNNNQTEPRNERQGSS